MCAIAPDEMLERFENCSLAEDELSHAGHVKLAFLYLRNYEVIEVLQRFPAALIRYAAAKGKSGLYHETITWAFVLLIHERIARMGRPATWEDFARGNEDLVRGGKKLLQKFYRDETIGSEFAKRTFVFPDQNSVDK
jgi:hypothetical protein